MEKKSYDIIFNFKNNPSVSLREINKLLVDIRKNTQEMATDVSRQISAVQSPVDDLRTKWLGLAGGMGASLALLSENASGIILMRKGLKTLLTEINSDDLFFIDRGIIVNIRYIIKLNNNILTLNNGENLIVSRPHLSDVKKKIFHNWNGRF